MIRIVERYIFGSFLTAFLFAFIILSAVLSIGGARLLVAGFRASGVRHGAHGRANLRHRGLDCKTYEMAPLCFILIGIALGMRARQKLSGLALAGTLVLLFGYYTRTGGETGSVLLFVAGTVVAGRGWRNVVSGT